MSAPSRLLRIACVAVLSVAALTACSAPGTVTTAPSNATPTPTPSPTTTATVSTAVTVSTDDCAVVTQAITAVAGMDDEISSATAALEDPSTALETVSSVSTALSGAADRVDQIGALAPLTRAAAGAYAAYRTALDGLIADEADDEGEVDSGAVLKAAHDANDAVQKLETLCAAGHHED
ncbi:hypothetical protein HQQ80_20065 [Microbacteriaceae bacterium VKM Ac-2855]|nr:hypothetical protein [Microbacteriaceae bacterium VKM Ac-2855]